MYLFHIDIEQTILESTNTDNENEKKNILTLSTTTTTTTTTSHHDKARLSSKKKRSCKKRESIHEAAWNDKFKLLEALRDKDGDVNNPIDDPTLRNFVNGQRKFYKHFRNGDFEKAKGMTEERISKLESLGLEWTQEAEMNNRIK